MKQRTLGLLCLVLSSVASVAEASPTQPLVVKGVRFLTPSVKPSATDLKTLTDLEYKYYHRTFEADLAEKRLSRLELFLTGTHRQGPLSERIASLKAIAVTASRISNTGSVKPTKHNLAQSITQLELSIQKSTSPNLKLEIRLANLEKKVFGRAFSGISLEQRIARLQKTIALTDDGIASAAPRGEQRYELAPPGMLFQYPPSAPYGSQNDLLLPLPTNRSMADMFNQLNRELRQLHKLPPDLRDSAPFDIPGMGGNLDLGSPGRDFTDGSPNWSQDYRREVKPLPPYMDPNSI